MIKKISGYVCALSLMAILTWGTVILANNNFHEVIPKQLYRSAQPRADDIAYYANHYAILSIINLRGENQGAEWYDNEIRETEAQGITFINFRMSAKTPLPNDRALALIDIMKKAPKPLLIHCSGGANRTSLATALYLAAVSKEGEDKAESQLSVLYGNLPHWLDHHNAISESFEKLEPILGFTNS